MAINLTVMPGAKEFILQQGGTVFIKPQPRLSSASCGTPQIITVPAVFAGNPPPEEETNYDATEINEVKVYIHQSLAGYNSQIPLRIDMEKTLFERRLAIGGFQGECCDSCDSCNSTCQVNTVK